MTGAVRLIQYADGAGKPALAAREGEGPARRIERFATTRILALHAFDEGVALRELALREAGAAVDLSQVRLLPAISHPDPAHLLVAGTGLTHLGSAEGRDRMHAAAAGEKQTDSLRMFLMGVEGGKLGGDRGVQPEWFYKGNGACLVGPRDPLEMPAFAKDGSEEPEIAGVYMIDPHGVPRRLGFALGNEFSDHVIERHNYLWLAHSKLRPAALGAELLLGDLPANVTGTSRVLRHGAPIWEKPFLTGEDNMSHSIDNLERHHFKYAVFRRPGDIHVHFFGTATLSFADGIATQEGDEFEIEADCFNLPLRNRLVRAAADDAKVIPA
ncbi:FAH family protein [Novosphingobium flavum]|uniref:FAH family protein n=1 Tax=Novosphingobium flavum TaxID=1778672 RepID=A0A7X1FQZ7_9SPHN|nr:AraD1 family protein [Novosphingobium flavum]MBC2664922.1 FAH family protein [Novosphingobium flavum]